jgi:hypothetical protein
MAVFSVLPPFLIFPDANGEPLQNGYIFIGQPGFEARTTPKASFFDTAQLIPTGTASGAAIRTMNGFPARQGTPAMFYVDGDFSISVLDRNGVLLYSALNTTLAVNLGGAIGPVLAPDGNLAAVGIGFIDEVNTGWVRSATGTVQYVVQGAVVAQMTATGVVFNQTIEVVIGSGIASAGTHILYIVNAIVGFDVVLSLTEYPVVLSITDYPVTVSQTAYGVVSMEVIGMAVEIGRAHV